MYTGVGRFAGEIIPPQLSVSPMADGGVGTLQGAGAEEQYIQNALLEAIRQGPDHADEVAFTDLREGVDAPSMDWLLDRFQDATGGVDPGRPLIQHRKIDPEATVEEAIGLDMESVEAQLQRFYAVTGLRRRESTLNRHGESAQDNWGGDANKFFGRVRLPERGARMRHLLHELGHCALPRVGLYGNRETAINIETLDFLINMEFDLTTAGLCYGVEDGGWKGTILEEGVAEALGVLANRKLRLTQTQEESLPAIVAPYISGNKFSAASPAALALELIAHKLGIPADRYFRMFVDYANVGVDNADARQEVAETIYRGTLGRLTLAHIEELPYPIHKEASLALLWAVEDAQDVPDNERYSAAFFG